MNQALLSQFIKGKSRDLQKLLRYLSRIVTLMCKNGISTCGDPSASLKFPGCGGLSGVPPTVFFCISYTIININIHQDTLLILP